MYKNDKEIIHVGQKLDYGTDKFWRQGWDMLTYEGNLDIGLDITSRLLKSKGKKVFVNIKVYSLGHNRDGIAVADFLKALSPQRKLLYLVLYNLGPKELNPRTGLYVPVRLSSNQIYRAMGHTGYAGDSDRSKIVEFLREFFATGVSIDNREEASAYKRKTFSVEKTRMVEGKITTKHNEDGSVREFAVIIYEPPVFLKYAAETHQITTIPTELLYLPCNLTDFTVKLNFFLISQIEYRYKYQEIALANPTGKNLDDSNNYRVLTKKCVYDHMMKQDYNERHYRRKIDKKTEELFGFYKNKKYINGIDIYTDYYIIELNPEVAAQKEQAFMYTRKEKAKKKKKQSASR